MGANTCRPPGTDGLPYLHCQYFDTNIPPAGRGNLGMNTFRKDGTANWNVAFGKSFRAQRDIFVAPDDEIGAMLGYASLLRLVHQMTLMTISLYNEPTGAYLPSVLY